MNHVQNPVTEKRRFPRIESNLPVTIEHDQLRVKRSICRNISEGGACLEVEFDNTNQMGQWIVQSKDTTINIEISLIRDKIKIKAIMKWNKRIGEDINRYRYGVEFLDLDPKYKNRISSFVNDRLKLSKVELQPIKEFRLLIAGEEVDTGRYRYFPYTEKVITEPDTVANILNEVKNGNILSMHHEYIYARYCVGNSETNNQAIISAYQASKSYRYFPLEKRVKIIRDIHNLLLENEQEFLQLLVIEGHPYKLARWELEGMLKGTDERTLTFYKENIEKKLGEDNGESIVWKRRPDGVVCLATPKNAPSSISIIGVFALLGGNTMIVKPPLSFPLSTIYFWKEIVYRAVKMNNAPDGTINIVTGNSHTIMHEWINSPYVNTIIYIGDSRKGIEIGKQIYCAGKKPILELSGNDIMIIWNDADIDGASDSLLDSFLGSTQICMVPKIAIIHKDVYNKFKDKFIEKVKTLKPGLPSDPESSLSIVGKAKEFFISLEDALQKGATLLYGGKKINWKGEVDPNGQFIQPTVISVMESPYINEMLCIKEEIFFPLLPLIVISGSSDEEIYKKVVRFVNTYDYGLRVSVWVNSPFYMERFIHEIHNCGILRVNSSHVGFSLYLSNNGGVNKSGGPFGEMSYIWEKTTHLQGISISRE